MDIPYKYMKYLDEPLCPPFFENDLDSYKLEPKKLILPENPQKSINIFKIYREMNLTWKQKDQNKMHYLFYDLFHYAEHEELLYCNEIIKYEITTIFYSCLNINSPRHLMLQSLEMITLVLSQKEKPLGDTFLSECESKSLIPILSTLTQSIIESLQSGIFKSNQISDEKVFKEAERNFIPLIRILVCLNRAVCFSNEGTEFVLNLFFKKPPFIIREIISMPFLSNEFDELIQLIKYHSCKLLFNLSKVTKNKNNIENLFFFICENWKAVIANNKSLVNNNLKLAFAMKYLVCAVYNFSKSSLINWCQIFIQKGCWELIETCLVVDNAELAVPAVFCIVQLIAQNANIRINYGYFIQLFQSFNFQKTAFQPYSSETRNQPIQKVIETIQTNPNPDQTNPSQIIQNQTNQNKEISIQEIPNQTNQIQKIQNQTNLIQMNSFQVKPNGVTPTELNPNGLNPIFEVESIPSMISNSEELVSLSCFAITRMVVKDKAFGQAFVSNGIFNVISQCIRKYPFKIQCSCIICLYEIIHCCFTSGFESLLEANIIELLVDFIQSNVSNLILRCILIALDDIFHMSLINGFYPAVVEHFNLADGNEAMKIISEKKDAKISYFVSKLFRTYKSISDQIENSSN